MTFRLVAGNAGAWPGAWMCEAPEVSAGGCHARASRADSATAVWRRELVDAIEEVRAEVR